MPAPPRIAVISDIHYASAAEQARGPYYETGLARRPAARLFLRWFRRNIWLRDPLQKNYLLGDFLARVHAQILVVNGDLSCDTGFVGLSDAAAMQSARECLAKLRQTFGDQISVTWGDHDLGKKDFYGLNGGMRLASARLLISELDLPPFWRRDFGRLVLAGIASPLIALESAGGEILPEEMPEWQRLRTEHIRQINAFFNELQPDQKVVLFCHDPTALPYLLLEQAVRDRIHQLDRTIIGHLHSPFILRQSRVLAGMPEIRFLGHTTSKLSRALRKARTWKPFKVELCPSPAGMEIFKDGGYGTLEIQPSPPAAKFQIHRLPRRRG
jgi:hypothetical protein